MVCSCVGVEKVDYDKKDGSHVVGLKLYVIMPPPSSRSANVDGYITNSVWISGSDRFLDLYRKCLNLNVPCELDVQYELDGHFQNLVDVVVLPPVSQ